MSTPNVIQCECAETGSIGFHQDKRPTLVLVGEQLYELTPSELKFKDLVEMSGPNVPHVRHLNRIPMRTASQQETENKSMIGYLKTPSAPKAAPVKVSKAEANVTKSTKTPKSGGNDMAGSKIKLVEDALKQRALTMDEMVAMGISPATVSVRLCKMKKAGYEVVKAEVGGKMTYKVNGTPTAK